MGLVLFLLAQPAVSQVPDDKLIVPGQRIGKWTLNMTIEDLLKMNGPRNVPRGTPGQGTPVDRMPRWFQDSVDGLWWHWWFNVSFSAATRGPEAQRVEYLFIEREDFRTDKNIAVEKTREEVEKAYGQPTAVTERAGTNKGLGNRRLIYDDIGMAVIVRQDGAVDKVFVFRPKTARTLWNF